MSEVKLWRYALPSIRGSGWAIFVLGSDGYFSAISDFGNYAYFWRAPGTEDFREFFLRVEWESDYFIQKLSPGPEYDGEETMKEIERALHDLMDRGNIDAHQLEREREALHNDYSIESSE